MNQHAAVWQPGLSISDFEDLLAREVEELLEHDRGCMKAFEVVPFAPKNVEEALAHRDKPPQMLVKGFLALGDEKEGRAFAFTLPLGLPESEDIKMAKQAANCIWQCVEDMKKERRQGRRPTPVISL